MRIVVWLVAMVLSLLAAGCAKERQQEQAAGEHLPDRLEDRIRLADLEGNPVDLAAHRGKTVFLNFWATWCRPCLAEFPDISRAAEILQEEGFVFLAASDEDPEKIRKFAAGREYAFRFVHSRTSLFNLDINALPTTMVINPQGKIVYNRVGARDWDSEEMLNMLRKLAKE